MMEAHEVFIYYGETALLLREVAQGITALTALTVAVIVLRFLWRYHVKDTVLLAAIGLFFYTAGTGLRACLEWYRTVEAGRGNRLDFEWMAAITIFGAILTICGGAICVYGFLPERFRLSVSIVAGVIALVVPVLVLLWL